ncbi:MAG: hemolysin family protein [Dehalococcoidia bacterium]
MDSDSSLAILILVVSLLAFAGVRLSQAAFLYLGEPGGLSWPEGEVAASPIRRVVSRYRRVAVLLSVMRMTTVLVAGFSLAVWLLALEEVSWGLGAFLAAVLLLLLALIHIITRALGRRFHRGVLFAVSPIMVVAEWTFSPFLWIAEKLNVLIQRWGYDGIDSPVEDLPILWEEASDLSVEEEVREADPEERRMIQAILRLEDVATREIMVPRVDIVAVDVDTPIRGVTALMADGGHSRIPVYKETIDNIVGIVHARDLLQSVSSEKEDISLADIVRPALFVPDSKPLDQLLNEFQEQRITIAVVVDEYGGIEGVITIEDLLEQIVGEIEDEFGREEPAMVRINEKEAIMDGRVTLDELNDLFRTSLEGEGFETLGGLISSQLGKIPVTGDSINVEGLTIRVMSTSGRRVRKVRVFQES